MVASDLADRILRHLRDKGPSKASQIATALGVERSAVNQTLYGPLRGKVRQAKDYSWSRMESGTPNRGASSSERTPSSSHRGLFSYYLDCLAQDDDSGVSTFADSKYDLDYVELESWPFDGAAANGDLEPLRKLIGRQRRDSRKKALWLGYPVLIQHVRSRRGWEGAFLQPLLVWPQDPDAGDFGFLPAPMINPRAIESLAKSENPLEEAARLGDELSLDAPDLPPIDELVARLREIRQEWNWKEALTPAPFRKAGEIRRIAESGIYNAAVAVVAERSPFTVGLERELMELKGAPDSNIAKSSLGVLLGTAGVPLRHEGLLLEPVPLNAEQRTAVRDALTAPITVITGPPGTGKSQVVSAILVNAAWRGLRVLLASKNHKAVDVVMERVNALSPRPIMLRLGTRALQEQLAQHISAILSSRPTEDDRRAYKANLERLMRDGEILHGHEQKMEELVQLRNRVDRLEQTAESARLHLSKDLFHKASEVVDSEVPRKVANLREAIRRADRREADLLDRLVWPVRRQALQQRVNSVAVELRDALKPFGFERGQNAEPLKLIDEAEALLDAAKAAAEYQSALRDLSDGKDMGSLAAKVAEQTKVLAGLSEQAWKGWTGLLPDRLNEGDRVALGDYAAILRTIAKTDEEGGSVSTQVWRRYYDLAAKTSKALPCWAVTSLSVRGRIPLNAGEFDLVVIDEASQCDIASAVPLLFRAKRAVLIGDPQQLRHISRLSTQRDQALLVKHDLLESPGPSWSYRANGLYDLAAARAGSESIVVLRDHHRSHADIINFSNEFFYGGRLRVATDYRRLKRPSGPAVRWVDVKGTVARPLNGGAVNQKEAAAVVEELRRLMLGQRFVGEIGVVTPFRAQANLIEELVSRDEALSAVLASRNFIAETAHRFQGDERDVVLFSPVVSADTPETAVGFLKGQGNIFNVGITRARGALVVVGDSSACASSDIGYLSAFARYVADQAHRAKNGRAPHQQTDLGSTYPVVVRPELVSDWEKIFYSALFKAGIRPIPQYDVDRYVLDFAVIRTNGRRLNIEIDGEHYHRDWDGELLRRDQLRNLRMIEMGWEVMRFWVYQVRDDLPECIERVADWVKKADAAPYLTIGEGAVVDRSQVG